MNFASPLLLLGLLGVAVPIIIHLVNRQRAVRKPFPAIRFLIQSNEKLARRLKLKQLVLLALRIGIFVLLPLAMAQPSLFCGGATSTSDGRLPTSVVLIVDDTGSMSAGDTARFERAIAAATEIVDDLRPWDQLALVFASDNPVLAVGDFTEDRGLVRDALTAHLPRYGTGSLLPALRAAREIQMTSKLPARRAIVLSDNTSVGLPDALDPAGLEGLGDVEFLDFSEGEPDTNCAVVGLTAEPSDEGAGDDYVFTPEIVCFGLEGQKEFAVSLQLGKLENDELQSTTVATIPVQIDGGSKTSSSLTASLVGDGPFVATAQLSTRSGHAVDDEYSVIVRKGRDIRALLIDGDPRSIAYNDEIFYLSRALRVGEDDSTNIESTTARPEGLSALDLSVFDVIVLANVDALPAPEVAKILAFVEVGGGLLISPGSNTNPDRWNSVFGSILPKPIRALAVLTNAGDPDAAIKAVRIAETDATHPIFRAFQAAGGEGIQSVSAYRYVMPEPDAESTARTIASFGDGAPALIEKAIGQGRVMMLTTTIDLDWTDLPIRTAYLPLMRRTVQYLARRGAEGDESLVLGEDRNFDVSALPFTGWVIVDPSGARHVVRREGDFMYFRPELAGAYRIFDKGESGSAPDTELFDWMFAANPPPQEYDPAAASAEKRQSVVTAAAIGGADSERGVAPGGTALWPAILFVTLLVIYAETLVAVRRRVWVKLGERLRARAA